MSHSRPLRAQRVARTHGTARQTPCPGQTPFSGQPGPGPLGAYGPYAPLRGAPIRHPAPPHPPARPPPTPRAHPRAPCPAPARPRTTAPDLPTGRLPRTAGRAPGEAVPRAGGRGERPLPGHGLRPRRIGRKRERPNRPGGPGTARGPAPLERAGSARPVEAPRGPTRQRRRCHFGHRVRGGVRRGGASAPKTHRQARPSPPSPQLRQSLRRDALEPRPPLAQAPPPRPPRPDGAGAGRGAGRVRVGRPEPVALHAADAGADGVRPPPLRAAATRLGTARSPALGAPVRDAVAVRGRGVCGPVLGGLPPRSRRPRRTGHPQRSST
ncbi:translation initiation factor IF-2 [Streptomyces sp. TverLS-915]|nr:translation initiation factor IF-2 [Streptomyces sp. TverLS-915]